jgi:hypothetical protein
VDGEDLREASHERAVEVIRKAGNRVTFLVQSLVDFVRFDFFKFVSKVCFKTFQLFFFYFDRNKIKMALRPPDRWPQIKMALRPPDRWPRPSPRGTSRKEPKRRRRMPST